MVEDRAYGKSLKWEEGTGEQDAQARWGRSAGVREDPAEMVKMKKILCLKMASSSKDKITVA